MPKFKPTEAKKKLDALDKWTKRSEQEISGGARATLNYPNIKKERAKLVGDWAKQSKARVDEKKARKGNASKVGGVSRPKGMY